MAGFTASLLDNTVIWEEETAEALNRMDDYWDHRYSGDWTMSSVETIRDNIFV